MNLRCPRGVNLYRIAFLVLLIMCLLQLNYPLEEDGDNENPKHAAVSTPTPAPSKQQFAYPTSSFCERNSLGPVPSSYRKVASLVLRGSAGRQQNPLDRSVVLGCAMFQGNKASAHLVPCCTLAPRLWELDSRASRRFFFRQNAVRSCPVTPLARNKGNIRSSRNRHANVRSFWIANPKLHLDGVGCVRLTCMSQTNIFMLPRTLSRELVLTLTNRSPSPEPDHLNVVYMFLDGSTSCLAQKSLPTFYKTLRDRYNFTRVDKHFPSVVPMGYRTKHNAMSMMLGWPFHDEILSSIFPDSDLPLSTTSNSRTETTFVSNATERAERKRVIQKVFDDSIFAHFKKHGYFTHAASGNEAVDASAGFMGVWSGHPYIDDEAFWLASEFQQWTGATVRPLAQDNIAQYLADNLIHTWRAVPKGVPKFSLLYDASAHFPHETMLQVNDEGYSSLLSRIDRELNDLSNTAVVLLSDHYNHAYNYLHSRNGNNQDRMLAEVWLPPKYAPPESIVENVKSMLEGVDTTQAFMSHYDMHLTVKHLATWRGWTAPSQPPPLPEHPMRHADVGAHATSLLHLMTYDSGVVSRGRQMVEGRICTTFGVPPELCPMAQMRTIPAVSNDPNGNHRISTFALSLFTYISERFSTFNRNVREVDEAVARYCTMPHGVDVDADPVGLNKSFPMGIDLISVSSGEQLARAVFRSYYTTQLNGVRRTSAESDWRVQVRIDSDGGLIAVHKSDQDSHTMNRLTAWGTQNGACSRRCSVERKGSPVITKAEMATNSTAHRTRAKAVMLFGGHCKKIVQEMCLCHR